MGERKDSPSKTGIPPLSKLFISGNEKTRMVFVFRSVHTAISVFLPETSRP